MLKAKYVSMYDRKKEDKSVVRMFVYEITGKQELVDRYVNARAANGYDVVKEDRVLFWTSRSLGEGTVNVELTYNNQIVEANQKLAHVESRLQNIQEPTLKAAAANFAAAALMGDILGIQTTQSVAGQTPAEHAEPKLGVE